MISIIKSNKPYRDFELGFMFYGFSFMIAWPVMTIFFNDVLEMNYSSVAFYKNQATLMSLMIWAVGRNPPSELIMVFIPEGALFFWKELAAWNSSALRLSVFAMGSPLSFHSGNPCG